MSAHGARARGPWPAVRLFFQALDDHADERPDAEIGRPRVRAGEPALGELVLHPGQQPRVVAAPALSVLASVGIPSVRRERTAPAVGLLMTPLEGSLVSLVAGAPSCRPVQVNVRPQPLR